jgi:hypothetical protein
VTRCEPVVNPEGARSASPRLPLPTEEELHDWYVMLRDRPQSKRLREDLGIPTYRSLVSQRDSYRATVHATIDGGSPLCGYPVRDYWIDHQKYNAVTCRRCNTIIYDEGYARG